MTRKSHQNYRSRCNWNYIYLQGVPKKVSFGQSCPKVVQSGPKYPKLAKTVNDNLDGPKWSKNIVSQLFPKNSTILDTPYKLFLQDGDLDHPLHIKDGLPLHNHMEDPVNVFPHKISTSTLKRGSTGSKRTFLLKEKRESIV